METQIKITAFFILIFILTAISMFAACSSNSDDTAINTAYTVTYDGNGNDGGIIPVDNANYEAGQTVTALDKVNLMKDKSFFAGWNTAADGSGTSYKPGDTFTIDASDVTLYAEWLECTEGLEYTLINGNTEYSVTKGTADTNGNVIIPEYWEGKEITAIEYQAFYQCKNMTSIMIPNSVTIIDDQAFYYCQRLTSVAIPNSVTTIGICAFQGCINLTFITIGDSVETIGWQAFRACIDLISVTIPDSVTTIGDGVFLGCFNLESVIIPDSVTTIGRGMFAYCFSLESIIIPESVTTIDSHAFSAAGLKSVTIPVLVNSIGNHAFDHCDELAAINVNATTPPALGGDAVFDNNKAGRTIYVPAANVDDYKAATYWSEYERSIAEQ